MNSGPVIGGLASPYEAAQPARPVRLQGPKWWGVRRDGDKASVSIIGEIGVYGATAAELVAQLEGVTEIELFINSCGGCTRSAFTLLDGFAGRVKRATILEKCFSAAVIVALSAKTVAIYPDARVMIHPACAFVYGRKDELLSEVANLEKLGERFAALLSERTGRSNKTVALWISGSDFFFSPEQARAAGLVHQILVTPAGPPAPARLIQRAGPEPSAGPPPPTEDENVILQVLTAFGQVEVRSRTQFSREMAAWGFINSTSTETKD